MPDLSGKTALVTGAAAPRGIGRAIALKLAKAGANVVVSDLEGDLALPDGPRATKDLLAEIAVEIQASGSKALPLFLDVTDPTSVEAAIQQSLAAFGSIDILVNNAGSLAGSDNFLSTTPEQWQSSFEVNILGPMMLSKSIIPIMRSNGGGRIINIGSTGSLGAEPGFGAYTAMKHALVGFSKTLAAEFGPDGILVNTVCPGYIATDMHEAANSRLAQEAGVTIPEMKARRYAQVALRDAGSPEDVANAVAFLAGPEGKYITGINLPVTGGVPYGI